MSPTLVIHALDEVPADTASALGNITAGSGTTDEYHDPMAGTVVSLIIAVVSLAIVSSFFTQRFLAIKSWSKLPLVVWLMFIIYGDSWLFVALSTVLRWGPGINNSFTFCSTAIFLCLVCYLSTKLVYLFLVEKAFIVWNSRKSRFQSKLYIFNAFCMLGIFAVIGILNFVYHIARVDEGGRCWIGMQRIALLPLVIFDLLVNTYLTLLFLIPLRSLYSFKNMPKSNANMRLRSIALRTFSGALTTTISSVLNITVMMVLDGEPGWVCLMACNIDILFASLVLQWVTSSDNAGSQTTHTHSSEGHSVAVQRSVVVHHSTNRTVDASAIRRANKAYENNDIVEEEIDMADYSTRSRATHGSPEVMKDDNSSEQSLVTLEELGNQTQVIGGRSFDRL